MVRPRDIVALLGEHQDRADALGDPRLSGQFYFRLGLTQFYLGDMDAVERAARRALAEARRSSDRLVSGLAHYLLSIRGSAVAPSEGLEAGRRAVEDLEAAQAPFWLGWSHYALGANLVWAGQFDGAREHLSAAVRMAEHALTHSAKLGSRWDEAWARRVLGRVALADGDLAAAEDSFRAALSAFAATRGLFEVARTQLALAEVTHARGNSAESTRLLADACECFRSLRVPAWLERAETLAAQLGLTSLR